MGRDQSLLAGSAPRVEGPQGNPLSTSGDLQQRGQGPGVKPWPPLLGHPQEGQGLGDFLRSRVSGKVCPHSLPLRPLLLPWARRWRSRLWSPQVTRKCAECLPVLVREKQRPWAPGQGPGDRQDGCVHGTWVSAGSRGAVAASQFIPHLTGLPFCLPPPPGQFYISLQHRQDPNDETASLHHVGDHPVQVNDGRLAPGGESAPCRASSPHSPGPGELAQGPRRNAT